jgi:hypothetical protein
MKKYIPALIASIVLAAATGSAFARGEAPGGFGGASSSHGSTQEIRNSNGPNAMDRDKGVARAQDRRNSHAMKRPASKKYRHKSRSRRIEG